MARPGFLKNPMPPAPKRPRGEVRSGSLGVEIQPAPWRYALQHDRAEDFLIWVTRGQGRVIVNGVRRAVTMHTALFLPAGTLFSIEMQPGMQALFSQCPTGVSPHMPQAPLMLRVRESLAQAELTGAMDAIHRETTQKRLFMEDAQFAHVALLAVWLQRQVLNGAEETFKETAAHRLVKRYARAVTRDFRSPALMAQYAEDLDVTPTHLSRVCKTCCDKTAANILTERKLHAARLALQQSTPPIKEVATSLGFTSAAYFTRFIQTHTGASPTALRSAGRRAAR